MFFNTYKYIAQAKEFFQQLLIVEIFSEWEDNFIAYLRDGGDAADFEEGEIDDVTKDKENRDSNNNSCNLNGKQLVSQLENMKALKEYAIKNGNRGLLQSTDATIRELEWLLSGGMNYVQPSITQFFSSLRQ